MMNQSLSFIHNRERVLFLRVSKKKIELCVFRNELKELITKKDKLIGYTLLIMIQKAPNILN